MSQNQDEKKIYYLFNGRSVRVPVGAVLELDISVNPFNDEEIKLSYDKDAFDVENRTRIRADEDEQTEYYDFTARKEGRFVIEGGIKFADGTSNTDSYIIDVVKE